MPFLGHVQAQMLDNSLGKAFSDTPFFNREFIQKNKVKVIRGKRSSKKEMDIIRNKGLETFYEFDRNGNLSKQYSSFATEGGKIDTTFIEYKYDEYNRLKLLRRNDVHGFYSYEYEYDALGNVVKEEYFREDNEGSSRYDFIPGKRYVIVSETYSYEWMGQVLKKNSYNNYGKKYKEEFFYYDENDYLIEHSSKLIINNSRSKTTYSYNEKGLIREKIVIDNLAREHEFIRIEYSYDELNNLEEEKEYASDTYRFNRQVMYLPNMLIRALLTKDVDINFIRIVEYSIDFY
jgi:hypothetical protein